jgi:hypothetical protein
VRKVLEQLCRFGLYANREKCSFFTSEVDFLSFIVSQEGICINPKRVKTITNWPRPKSIYKVQVFFRFVNFYRRFIKGYSHIARPLTDLLKGSDKGIANSDPLTSLRKGSADSVARERFMTNAPQQGSKGTTDSCPLTNLHKQSSRGKASSDSLTGQRGDSAGSTVIERPLTDMLSNHSTMTHKAHPLTNAPKTGNRSKVSYIQTQWQWTTAAKKAFTWLKQAFCCTTILAYFDPRIRIRVETNASKYAIAAILS